MFRIPAKDVHAWQDIALNVGKLSLAGMFLAGTFLLAHAYADSSTNQPSLAKVHLAGTFPLGQTDQ